MWAKFKMKTLVLFAVTAVLLSIAGSVHAQSGAQPEACGLAVRISGQGAVDVARSGAKEVRLGESELNAAPAQCGELLRLSAVPAAGWRFQGWQLEGVAEQRTPTLETAAPVWVAAVFVPRELRYLPLERPVYDRSGALITELPVYASLWDTQEAADQPAAVAAPQITLWYGARQPAGVPGLPQEWIDVLGNVSFAGSDPSLRYKLNGSAYQPLNFGGNGSVADGRRLYDPGDFVINLAVADLQEGNNVITVRAVDSTGTTSETIVVEYTSGQVWPIPANVDWDRTGDLLDEAAVVDGQWGLTAGGEVRTLVTGYDRVLAVGDISWDSYEAVVPVTIHSYNSDGFQGLNFAPAVGIVMGWQGHTDNPIVCDQPKCGWLPVGMATWYEWDKPETGDARFKMWVKHQNKIVDPSGFSLDEGETYLWKVQANRGEGPNGTYRLKVWRAGATEPNSWLMVQPGTADSQAQGSILLLAHHVDLTFGDVRIRPLNGDFAAPVISNLTSSVTEREATLQWNTNEPATAEVVYYSDPADKKTATSANLATSHRVDLENLAPGTAYTVEITVQDDSLNQSMTTTSVTTAVQKFILNVDTTGFGNVQISPKKPGYEAGEQVTLTAVPGGPSWVFAGWGGDAAGNQNPLTVTINQDTNIRADFKKADNYLPFIVNGD